jgi:fatty acid desaturase 6
LNCYLFQEHHAYTNIIGIGDSSTWRVPMVPAFLYMFVTPLLVPLITPFISVVSLWGQWFKLIRHLFFASIGLFCNFYLFMKVSRAFQGFIFFLLDFMHAKTMFLFCP